MKRRLFFFIATLVALGTHFYSIQAQTLRPNTLYVNFLSGNDDNPGTTPTKPLKSVSKAFAREPLNLIFYGPKSGIISEEIVIRKNMRIFAMNGGSVEVKDGCIAIYADSVYFGGSSQSQGIKFIGSDTLLRIIYAGTDAQSKSLRILSIQNCSFEGIKTYPTGGNSIRDPYVSYIQVGSNTGDSISKVHIKDCTFGSIGGGKSIYQGERIITPGAGIIFDGIIGNAPGEGILIEGCTFDGMHQGAFLEQKRPIPAVPIMSLPTDKLIAPSGVLIRNNRYINSVPNNQYSGFMGVAINSSIEEKRSNYTNVSEMAINIFDFCTIKINEHITSNKLDVLRLTGLSPKDVSGFKPSGSVYFSKTDSAVANSEKGATITHSAGTFESFSTDSKKGMHFIGIKDKTFIAIKEKGFGINVLSDSCSFKYFTIIPTKVGAKEYNGTAVEIIEPSLVIKKLAIDSLIFKGTINGIVSKNTVLSNTRIAGVQFENIVDNPISLKPTWSEKISLEGNILLGNTKTPSSSGITLGRGKNILLSKNQITNISGIAIQTQDGENVTLLGNQISKSSTGIVLQNIKNLVVQENTINQIGSTGIKTSDTKSGIPLLITGVNGGNITKNTIYGSISSKDPKDNKEMVHLIVSGIQWTATNNSSIGCSTITKLSSGISVVLSGYGSFTNNSITGAENGVLILSGSNAFNLTTPISFSLETASLIKLGSNTFSKNIEQDVVVSSNQTTVELVSDVRLDNIFIKSGTLSFGSNYLIPTKSITVKSGKISYTDIGFIKPDMGTSLINNTGAGMRWPVGTGKGRCDFELSNGSYTVKLSTNTLRTSQAIDLIWDIEFTGSPKSGLFRTWLEGTKHSLPSFTPTSCRFAEIRTGNKLSSLENPGQMILSSGFYTKEFNFKNSGKFMISSEKFTSIIETANQEVSQGLLWNNDNHVLKLWIESEQIQIESFEIIDLQGRVIIFEKPNLQSNNATTNTDTLTPGVYLLRVVTSHGIGAQKILIQ